MKIKTFEFFSWLSVNFVFIIDFKFLARIFRNINFLIIIKIFKIKFSFALYITFNI